MVELKSALLFGVTMQFKMKMGPNSPGLIWFGLVSFGFVIVYVCLMEKEVFQYVDIIVTTLTQLQPQHNLT